MQPEHRLLELLLLSRVGSLRLVALEPGAAESSPGLDLATFFFGFGLVAVPESAEVGRDEGFGELKCLDDLACIATLQKQQ